MNADELNELSNQVVGAAIEVHKAMGPGQLEGVYEDCLVEEFRLRGLKCERQVRVPLIYKGRLIHSNYCIDLLVEGEIVVELKAVTEIHPVFSAQIISYLRLANKRMGYLLNFHSPVMKDGVRRYVNGL
jgi:GxxExxY protein